MINNNNYLFCVYMMCSRVHIVHAYLQQHSKEHEDVTVIYIKPHWNKSSSNRTHFATTQSVNLAMTKNNC